MIMTIQESLSSEATEYCEDVARSLSAVNETDRAEMLGELRSHLVELDAELSGDGIADQLGSPQMYARELMKSIGIEVLEESTGASARLPLRRRVPLWSSQKKILTGLLIFVILSVVVGWTSIVGFKWVENRGVASMDDYQPASMQVVPNLVNEPVEMASTILIEKYLNLCEPEDSMTFDSGSGLVVLSQDIPAGTVVDIEKTCVKITYGSPG